MSFNPGWIPLIFQNLKNKFIATSQKGAANGVAPLGSDGNLPSEYLPDELTVNAISIPQGSTSGLDAANLADGDIALDTTQNRFRVGTTYYSKYSEVMSRRIAIPFIPGNFYRLTTRGGTASFNPLIPSVQTGFEYFILEQPLRLKSINLFVYTTGTQVVNFAIYDVDINNMKPKNRLTNILAINATATGGRQALIDITLQPGIYLLGNFITGNSGTFASYNQTTSEDNYLFGQKTVSDSVKVGLKLVSGTSLPSTISPSEVEFDNMIGIQSSLACLGFSFEAQQL